MCKLMVALITGLIVLAAGSAQSQELPQLSTLLTLPIRPDDMGFYCIFENRVYSPGAQICLDVVRSGAPSQAALVCKPPAASGGRAVWESSGTITCASRAPR
jgi:hypothetical protein